MALRQLVTIEESTILGMLQDVRYLNEFPFLRNLKTKLDQIGDCGSCTKRKPEKIRERREALTATRVTFAHLPGNSRAILKHLLQTKKVRVIYFSDNGRKKIQLTY